MNKVAVGLLIILAGVGVIGWSASDAGPQLVCVDDNADVAEGFTGLAPSSGFTDPDQNDCRTTIESQDAYNEWLASPKPERMAAIVLIFGGGIVAGLGLRSKNDEASSAQ